MHGQFYRPKKKFRDFFLHFGNRIKKILNKGQKTQQVGKGGGAKIAREGNLCVLLIVGGSELMFQRMDIIHFPVVKESLANLAVAPVCATELVSQHHHHPFIYLPIYTLGSRRRSRVSQYQLLDQVP